MSDDAPFLWIRHGRTELPPGSICGQMDPAPLLLPEEIDQIVQTLSSPELASILAEGALWFSSPLRRCLLLARALIGQGSRCRDVASMLPDDRLHLDDRLKEISFGRWEGLVWDDIGKAEFDLWAEDYMHRSPPGGESMLQLCRRLQSFLDEARLARQFGSGGRPIVVVCHAGIIRALAVLVGVPTGEAMALSVPFGSIHRLFADGRLVKIG